MAASFDLLSSAYVSSNTTSINFSSISQAYDDLYFLYAGKCNVANLGGRELTVTFNNVTSQYYFGGGILKDGGTITHTGNQSVYAAKLGKCVASRGNYNYYPNNLGVCELWLNEYSTSGKQATGMFSSGCHANNPNATGYTYAAIGGIYTNQNFTAAITQVTFACEGYSFEPGTKIWMYGLKSS
mgnify:CR=1 FL=1